MDFAVTAPLKTVEGSDIAVLMEDIGRQAKSAARALASRKGLPCWVRRSRTAVIATISQTSSENGSSGMGMLPFIWFFSGNSVGGSASLVSYYFLSFRR